MKKNINESMIYGYMLRPIQEGIFDKFKQKRKEKEDQKRKEKAEKDIKECNDKIEEYLKTGINNGSERSDDLIYYIKNNLNWSEQQLKTHLNKLKNNFKTIKEEILDCIGPQEDIQYQYFVKEMPKNVKEDHKITFLFDSSDSALIYDASNGKFYFVDYDYKRPYMEEISSLYQTAIDWKIIDESSKIESINESYIIESVEGEIQKAGSKEALMKKYRLSNDDINTGKRFLNNNPGLFAKLKQCKSIKDIMYVMKSKDYKDALAKEK